LFFQIQIENNKYLLPMPSIFEIKKKYSQKIDPFDLDLLIAHSIGKTREFVLAYPEFPINPSSIGRLKSKISRRAENEPLAYILGIKEFYGLEFKVNKNTLIPRPETEIIVEETLKYISKNRRFGNLILADLGTGSGNIIISLAHNLKKIKNNNILFYATDISRKALHTAKYNAKKNDVDGKIKFLPGDLLFPIIKKIEMNGKSKMIILANLPYLENNWRSLLKDKNSAGLKFEPKIALDGGSHGFYIYKKLSGQIREFMKNHPHIGLTLFCEIGQTQKNGIIKIFSFADKIVFFKDLSGKWRTCMMKF